MASPRLVRRALTLVPRLGAVAVLASTLVVGFPGSGEAGDPEVHETTIALPDGALDGGWALPLEVAGGPELIAFTWDAATEATLEVRAHDGDGWGEWFELEGTADEGPDATTNGAPAHGYAGPAFLGRDISDIEVRSTTPSSDLPGLVVHAIDSEPTAPREGVAGAAVAQPPPITTRAQWGADESWRDDSGGECDFTPDYSDDIQVGFVHHTVSRNDYTAAEVPAILRGIYDFHVHSNGWCDVGYSFFVDRFGTVYEGRFGGIKRTAIGGHTSGFNTVATGVAVVGDFTSPVPDADMENVLDGLTDILSFKLAYHGVDPKGQSTVVVGSNTSAKWPEGTSVTLQNISGHQDGNKTSCPGAELYKRLPELRNRVAERISSEGLQPAFTLGRLSGADRYATAATIAKSTFGSSNVAFLARGDGFADALAANFLAGFDPAPVLLAAPTSVPQATLDVLKSLGTKTVHLLGGTAALGPQVESALQTAGYSVHRIAGADRYETAAAIARTAHPESIGVDDAGRRTVVLSAGLNFPDALAAGGIVYAQHLPQLLTDANALSPATAAVLKDLAIGRVIITGGPAAVSSGVESTIAGLGIVTERIAGATRYETAIALADLSVDRFGFSPLHADFATGQQFPDALTGGAHAGRGKAPLLLVDKPTMPPAVCGFLQRRSTGFSGGHILGGRSAVEGGVKYSLEECLYGIGVT